jgi:hypothetical protein
MSVYNYDIILDPDVKIYFPNSESVNSTLRSLIKLIPQQKWFEMRSQSHLMVKSRDAIAKFLAYFSLNWKVYAHWLLDKI